MYCAKMELSIFIKDIFGMLYITLSITQFSLPSTRRWFKTTKNGTPSSFTGMNFCLSRLQLLSVEWSDQESLTH
jgi:hypothetical protein